MQKSEFSIKINLITATLMANRWCLWIETTPQLWIQSRFMYLYPFKPSLKVHTSWVASVTHFNLNNPNHYHCTCSAESCHTMFISLEREKKKKPQMSSWPLQVASPFAGAWSLQAQQDFPSMDSFLFSSAGKADTQLWLRLEFTEWRWAIVFLGSAASDLLV